MRRTALLCAPKALSAPAVTQALQSLPGWRVNGNNRNAIERDYVFADFMEAMRYMNTVAPVCEKMQHHPCWSNVYNRLHVQLTTHDAGNTVTQKDVDLAKAMNAAYEAMRTH
ncbi:pterin-4-alpha-carbinolamine dehydratase,putative [Leishmania mexicana MHOM/GT/2001/U1103]|uniref:4a-hydroxytetrahydrobiopterin dehydratase n=1 Tax=Leishmania mexicana (strain MHOM/GT/2001/U1103) TaxID=929439 RepID=E9ANG8_LEIMU|nr:pterin-4-alpha-carbinolamine dehydratase,putative [Leishmania mexicana MHOM/GT/2001/U1103]CBZ24477.1 pterin-4-alpha-carbinolamine dehydratase,putative [Leishmania mexicana MHOM/GT/2001/U1103]